MRDVAAIVVTYNRKEMLKACISKLSQQEDASCDVLVIDNASTDGTYDYIKKQIDKRNVFYFNTGSNLGGAGGFCYGMKKAVEIGYTYLWIMDDDAMPTRSALAAFLRAHEKLGGTYGYLTGKSLWKDGSICTMNIQKKTKWKRVDRFDHMQTVQYASFVSLFVKAEIVKQVGLPYKEFFIWADDWEYTRRISKRFRSYFIPDSIVNHQCETNVGADIMNAPDNRLNRFQYMYRNDVVMYRQDGPEGYLYLFIRNTVHMIRILMRAEKKARKIKLIWKATAEGVRFHPQIEYPYAQPKGII